jgi:ferredoxin
MPSNPPFSILIRPSGMRFQQLPGQSLLQSALAGRIRLPSSCRNGACRACMCKLSSGEVDYQIEWPGLTREEKEEGWILPCVAQARSDLAIEAPDAVDLNK